MATLSWQAKVERCREHLQMFEQVAAECLHVRPEDMTLEGKKEVGDGVLVTQSITIASRPIPLKLSAIAGDAFHNLRSALDHIAVALSRDQRAAFPILSAVDAPKLRELEKFLAKIPGQASAVIRNAQPYLQHTASVQPLAVLQELDNLDKHRALMFVAAYYQTESAEPQAASTGARVHAVRLGAGIGGQGLQELFSLDMTIPQGANLSVAFTIRSEVKFASEGPVKDRNVLHVGQELLAVSTGLLNQLEAFVP